MGRASVGMARCVTCLLAAFACLAQAEEAKLKPKNIDISLSARWPASPVTVEAAEFMAEEEAALFWRFAEGLAQADAAPEHVRRGGGTICAGSRSDSRLPLLAGLSRDLLRPSRVVLSLRQRLLERAGGGGLGS